MNCFLVHVYRQGQPERFEMLGHNRQHVLLSAKELNADQIKIVLRGEW